MQVFGADNVYFEVQKNGVADQDKANEGIVEIAREVGRPLVGTGDVHYLGREDYDNHARAAVRADQVHAGRSRSSRFDTNEFYLKDSDEMEDASRSGRRRSPPRSRSPSAARSRSSWARC